MKIYFDCYGILSMNKKNAIKFLESMLRNDGEYNIYDFGGKYLKVKDSQVEFETFMQGGKMRVVSMNLVKVTDDWENRKCEVIQLLDAINR